MDDGTRVDRAHPDGVTSGGPPTPRPVATRRRRWTIGGAVVALAAIVGGGIVATSVDEQSASQTAQETARPLAALCATDPAQAAALGANCPLAEQIAAGVPPADAPGAARDGAPGRGIVSTTITGGRLLVTFDDGATVDVGPVLGQDGRPGENGAAGAPGRGIVATSIVDGRLVVSYSDGTTANLGVIVGPAGVGISGLDGSTGRLLVTLTDGTVVDAGPLPQGPKGDPGTAGAAAPSVSSVTRRYSDGAVETCTRAGGPDSDPQFACQRSDPDPAPTTPAEPDAPTTEGGG